MKGKRKDLEYAVAVCLFLTPLSFDGWCIVFCSVFLVLLFSKRLSTDSFVIAL